MYSMMILSLLDCHVVETVTQRIVGLGAGDNFAVAPGDIAPTILPLKLHIVESAMGTLLPPPSASVSPSPTAWETRPPRL
jgi:hypothetical protein